MTGPEMKAWRNSTGLTLREVVDTYLPGRATHTTLSRWEQSEKPIPQWASDIFLGATKITLSVAELHALLDYARRTNQSFNDVLALAIRSYLDRQNAEPEKSTQNIRTPLTPAAFQTTTHQEDSARVAEDPLPYPMQKETKRDMSEPKTNAPSKTADSATKKPA